MLIEYLKPGMRFFDIGTHFGYFTLLASSLVGEAGIVHSFEPTPSTFEILRANASTRRNVTAFNVAMYSSETTIPFRDYGLTHSAYNSAFRARASGEGELSFQALDVKATTVDAHADRTGVRPDFVKIDAESAEFAILQGMERTIATNKPIITVEVGDMDIDGVKPSSELIGYLEDRGYAAMEYADGVIRPHQRRERYEYDNILFAPRS
jgi:FkbM family methyltransferase